MNRTRRMEMDRLRGILNPEELTLNDPDEPLDLGDRWWLVLDMRPHKVRHRAKARADLPSLTTNLWSSAAELTGIAEGLAGRQDLRDWSEGPVMGKNRRPRSRFWLEVGSSVDDPACCALKLARFENLLSEVGSWRLYHSTVVSGDVLHHRLYALAQPINPVESFFLRESVLTAY